MEYLREINRMCFDKYNRTFLNEAKKITQNLPHLSQSDTQPTLPKLLYGNLALPETSSLRVTNNIV